MLKRIYLIIPLLLTLCSAAGQDITPPAPVLIDSVSVDINNGDVRIKWGTSSSVDCAGYYLYQNQGGLWIQVAQINAPQTSYIHTTASATTKSEEYRVAAYDNVVPVPNLSELCPKHNTIFLEASFDSCRAETQLNWNPYINWATNVYQYKVYSRIDGGPWSILAVVPGSQLSYKHKPVLANRNYSYYVRAVSVSGQQSSASNRVDVYTSMPPLPTILNADYCSVIDDGRVALAFTIDPGAAVIRYRLQRANSLGGPFNDVAEIMPWEAVGNKLYYTDYVPTRNNFFYWKIIAVNSCNVDIDESNVAGNMNVYVVPEDNMRNIITWTNYEQWLGGIWYYEVFRILNGVDTTKVGEILYGDTLFRDNLESFFLRVNNLDPNGRNGYYNQPQISGLFCYYVVAHEGNTNPYGIVSAAKSNTSCAIQKPRVFVPNAFTPNGDGINDVFQPFVTFGSVPDYSFRIFDRWGHLIWEANNTHVGWDGKLDGQLAPSGTYIYQIELTDPEGKKFQETKPFSLLILQPFITN